MRKILISLVVLCSLLSAQNLMKLDSLQIAMNDTGKMSIQIENQDDFVGFQCDINFPSSLTLLDMELTERATNHNLTLIDKGNNRYQILVYSITNDAYTGHDGEVVDMYIVSGSVQEDYLLSLDSAVIGNASAENILSGVENGFIEVIDTTNSSIEQGSLIPTDHKIRINNYPNPFNPGTIIKYKLDESSEVDLSIYDAKGSKIRTIYEGFQTKGNHEYSWNGQNYPSGIYYAQLTTDETITYCKLIFVK